MLIKHLKELREDDIVKIIKLKAKVWPDSPGETPQDFPLKHRESTFYLIKSGSEIQAMAETFLRTITAGSTPHKIMALASVCVDPAQQGNGLGKAVVEKVFIDMSGKYEFSIFQTGVPGFYKKLVAKLISNRFINSEDPTLQSPWWDSYVMIYPSTIDLEDHIIDLKGPAY